MITRKSTYGLRALAGMARDPQRLYSLTELARDEGIPKAYLTLILGTLRRHGVLEGLRGPAGGYALARDPRQISLASVVEILDGPLFLGVDCLSPGAPACAECPEGGCSLRRALGVANRAAWNALEAIAVSDLALHAHPRTQPSEIPEPKKNLTSGRKT
jgi:Rrf2 family protein